MISIHSLLTIGKYEMRTLLRSWFFRIFAGLSILSIGIFNIAANITNSGAPFIYRALPASLPYTNLLLLNLGQAIVAVFLASEFLKQDRKNDTVEVIYARSMTNAEYILGKALGILSVFFILNIIILVMGIGFSFISGDASQGILEYFYYPLLISMPTLVYILGLSFFIMILTKNQAITFILLLGYIAVSIFYLDKQFYQVFDFIAYQVPMMNSTIGGFGDFNEILIHRGIYLFIGLGLIFFTITKIDRLPQSKRFSSLPILLSILFITAGAYTAYIYISKKKDVIVFKKNMISLNNTYLQYPKATIDSCNINLLHEKTKIEADVLMYATNNNDFGIDTLILSLNPSLIINELKINNSSVSFTRETQIIKITLPTSLEPKQKTQISINYEGSINENTCFLDQNLDIYKDNFSFEIFRIKKRYAYLNEDYVLLTRDALWYPISGVGYSDLSPASFSPGFTNYSLTVTTDENLLAISQGTSTNPEPGVFKFTTDVPIPQISLLIGDYVNYNIIVDSIEYGIYTIEGNDYYSEYFTDITDSLPGVIRELKNEYETLIDLEYPFKRFSLAEVPIQFDLSKHVWSLTSDAVQPEITFYIEKGVVLEETDFKKRKKRTERNMNRDNEDVTPTELQSRIFKRFSRGNFMADHNEWYMFDGMDRNTLSLFPNYLTFITSLDSERWPALNLSLQAYLKDRYSNPISSYRWFFTDLSRSERINLELKESSLANYKKINSSRQSDSDDNDAEITLYDLIIAKGDYLFSVLTARYGDTEFNSMLDDFIKQHHHESFNLEQFDVSMQNTFNESIVDEVNKWYYEQSMPGFLLKELETYKVRVDEYTRYQIKFKITNPEKTDGIVTINIDLYDPNDQDNRNDGPPDFSRKIYLPAGEAREVGFVFASEPLRMNLYTHISLNLPNNIIYDFESFNETKKVAVIDGIKPCEPFNDVLVDGEIIVDNEDSTFSYSQDSKVSYLKNLIDASKDPGYKYSGIRYWNPPVDWQHVLRSGFYGKYVRSAMYTSSGQDDRIATWNANIETDGYYDVYCHIEKIHVNRRHNQSKKADYNFAVHHQDGVEKINLTDGDLENGWNYLGTYFITPSTGKVELSNKSVGSMIFADAIKWVKN
jgi:ABC-type transport system involved in multi-copper enzyme maturation permease subunit